MINFETLYYKAIKRYCSSASCPLKQFIVKADNNLSPLSKDEVVISKAIKKAHSQHHYFQDINHRKILNQNVIDEKALKEIDDEFLEITPMSEESIFYRGIGKLLDNPKTLEYDIIDKANIGDIIQPFPGYAYTATRDNYTFASRYAWTGDPNKAKAMLLEIHTPKGAKISVNREHGGEGVFPRNAKYRVISKTNVEVKNHPMLVEDCGETFPRQHIILEYIPE